jgi:hypothetical protein
MRDSWHGASHVSAAGLAAAVGEGSEALSHLRHFLADLGGAALYRGSGAESGAETAVSVPLAAGQAAVDLLLDSWGGSLRVFPATPQEWPDAMVAGLRAPGAFLVDAARSHGRTDWIRVRSEAGEPLLLDHGIEGPSRYSMRTAAPGPGSPAAHAPCGSRSGAARASSWYGAGSGPPPSHSWCGAPERPAPGGCPDIRSRPGTHADE